MCVARHPSQLYEALLEGLILGGVLLWLVWRRDAYKTPGLIAGTFFLGYGIARFAVEFVRQPDAQFVSAGNPLGLALELGWVWPNYGSTTVRSNDRTWALSDTPSAAHEGSMSLHDLLAAQIAANGPIRLSDFMADCLLHPEFGYYTTQEPFGASGDFVTAPGGLPNVWGVDRVVIGPSVD